MSTIWNLPDSPSSLRSRSPTAVRRSCSSLRSPCIWPSRLVSSISKSNTASLGASAAWADAQGVSNNSATTNSALTIVTCNTASKKEGCKLRQFVHVASRVLHLKEDREGDAMIRHLIGAIGLSVVASHALAAEPLEIGVGYLRHAGVKETLSLVQQPAENNGVAGARLAIADNNTTGKFLHQHFTLDEVRLK